MEKTNVMRVLDGRKLPYRSFCYLETGALSGAEVAAALGQDPCRVFKTLVTTAKSGQHYVFMIPVEEELDLKKAAQSVGEKAISMLKAKELLPLTGYVHGGCSPVGMKKAFPTVFDESVNRLPSVIVSAGRIGFQIECAPADLLGLTRARTAPVTTD